MSQLDPAFAAPTPMTTLSIAELESDTHAVFRRYRPIAPVIIREGLGFLVLRSRDVEALMKDPRIRSVETEYPEMRGVTEGALHDNFKYGMLTSNDAVHRARRSPFTRLFAAGVIAKWRPIIRKTAEQLVDGFGQVRDVDLIEQFAALIPAHGICQLVGFPEEDIHEFIAWVYKVSLFIGSRFTPADIPDMEAAAQQLQVYVDRLLTKRRALPTGDFLSSFLENATGRGELTEFEMTIQIVLLIIGGTDTTRVSMAMQVALLLQHREQWEAICRDPSLIPAAISECLRYEPSVASVPRFTREEVSVDGYVLPKGSPVTLSTMSANRDEDVFREPDVFNIRRTDFSRIHPSFGGGAHRCIGEALARAELEEGLAVLAERFPNLQIVGPAPIMQGHAGIRRITDMHVALGR